MKFCNVTLYAKIHFAIVLRFFSHPKALLMSSLRNIFRKMKSNLIGRRLSKKRFVWFLIIATCFTGLFYSVTLKPVKLSPMKETVDALSKTNFIEIEKDSNKSESKTKYLLDWTTYFGTPMVEGFEGHHYLEECPELNCKIISDKSLIKGSDAVLFHAINIAWNELPSYRRPDQYFVFFSWEPPTKTDFDRGKADGYFNLTMSYRLDSDFFSPYGETVKLPSKKSSNIFNESKVTEVLIRNKTKFIAWFASQCDTFSNREDYVKELQKFVTVDVYGNCGQKICKPLEPNCFDILYQYKFYLSFENSVCRDYVTEKLFGRIAYFLVPIVLNKTMYEEQLPKKSVISATDFSSVKELANYLEYLNKNMTAYLEYFEWRKEYSIVNKNWMNACQNPMKCSFCSLCSFLHMKKNTIKVKSDVYEWWHKDTCDSGLVSHLLGKN